MRKKCSIHWFRTLSLMMICGASLAHVQLAQAQTGGGPSTPKTAELQVTGGPIPARVLVQSPAETVTELQIICLFTSAPENTLHGSLVEMNEKLKGLLDQLRKPSLFRGEFGETVLIEPPTGSLGAKRLLIIGLGDTQTFSTQRMELVGSIVYREASRLRIAHPFFAPTILDGGVAKFTTGDVAENFTAGFLRAARTEKLLENTGASQTQALLDLTFLAGAAHAADTQKGIERAFDAEAR